MAHIHLTEQVDIINHRMVCVGNDFKDYLILSHMPWAGTLSTTPSCSMPHPIQPWTLPEIEYPQLLRTTCSITFQLVVFLKREGINAIGPLFVLKATYLSWFCPRIGFIFLSSHEDAEPGAVWCICVVILYHTHHHWWMEVRDSHFWEGGVCTQSKSRCTECPAATLSQGDPASGQWVSNLYIKHPLCCTLLLLILLLSLFIFLSHCYFQQIVLIS